MRFLRLGDGDGEVFLEIILVVVGDGGGLLLQAAGGLRGALVAVEGGERVGGRGVVGWRLLLVGAEGCDERVS